ncbi:MAG: hypothetical protein ACLTSD_08790 [Eubacterium sp.]
MEKKDLRSLTIEEMTELAESMGQKTFRGKQLFEWIHKKQVENLEEISNLPKAFLEPLQENYMVSGVALVKKQMSKAGDTAKYLFSLADGNLIESVWMKYHQATALIQVDAGWDVLCASTLTGLTKKPDCRRCFADL